MSRMYRYATIGLIWILAIMMHYMAVELFAPGTNVYALGEPGVGTYIAAGWRDQLYKIFVQYIPLLFMASSLVWGFAKEYEDVVYTGRVR